MFIIIGVWGWARGSYCVQVLPVRGDPFAAGGLLSSISEVGTKPTFDAIGLCRPAGDADMAVGLRSRLIRGSKMRCGRSTLGARAMV